MQTQTTNNMEEDARTLFPTHMPISPAVWFKHGTEPLLLLMLTISPVVLYSLNISVVREI